MDPGAVPAAFLTTAGTLLVVELTDKDALFLLALATKARALVVFAAGAVAFTISTAIILGVGSVLISLVPVIAIRLASGAVMLVYAAWEYSRFTRAAKEVEEREERLMEKRRKGDWSIFAPAVFSLVALDLAGDATELVSIVLLARFQDVLLVFLGAVAGLVVATAVETALGNRLGTFLSEKRIRYLSVGVFAAIGSTVIAASLLGA